MIRTIILLSLVFLQACSNDAPSLRFIPQDGVILAFGDSLTVGVGASQATSYPSMLAQLSNRHVVNAGVSGEETTAGLKRLPVLLDEVVPNLLLLLEGGNDILRNKNLLQTKQNLAAMIELAQTRGIEVVLIGVPEKKIFSDVHPLYEELAIEYKLVFADDLLSSLLRKNKYKSDAVHLNDQGYRAMAESLHTMLVEYGGL